MFGTTAVRIQNAACRNVACRRVKSAFSYQAPLYAPLPHAAGSVGDKRVYHIPAGVLSRRPARRPGVAATESRPSRALLRTDLAFTERPSAHKLEPNCGQVDTTMNAVPRDSALMSIAGQAYAHHGALAEMCDT